MADYELVVLDLDDPSDLQTLLNHENLTRYLLSDMLRLPTEFVGYYLKNGMDDNTVSLVLSAYSCKYNTSRIFYKETNDIISDISPYYHVGTLTCPKWFEKVGELVSDLCEGLEYREDTEEVRDGTDASVLLRFRKNPQNGYVMMYSEVSGVTTVRLYTESLGTTVYLPHTIYNKSSSRYNRITDSHLQESLELLILSLSKDDYLSLSADIYSKSTVEKVLSLEEAEKVYTSLHGDVPTEFMALFMDTCDCREEENYKYPLWRCTNLRVTLDKVLETCKDQRISKDAREYLGTLLVSKVMSEQIAQQR